MEDKNLIENATSRHSRAYKEIEIAGYYSGTFDFETNHLIGRKTKAIIAALLGTIIEWYDYSLYGYMAVILSQHFFPNTDPSVSLTKHFLVFALGFLAKPLGAYIFGSIGDKYGRKYALRWSILGISIPTVIIGLLPSYEQLGIIAVILLCCCRFAQGIFITAESDGVDIFVYETMPKKHACLANSFTWISSGLGMCLASFLVGITLSSALPIWAWRLPFLFAGILGLFTLWYRHNLIESYDYMLYAHKTKKEITAPSQNYFNIIKRNKNQIFLAILIKGAVGGVCNFYFFFWCNYLQEVLNIISIADSCTKSTLLITIPTMIAPLAGYIADRLGVIKTVKLAVLLCLAMMVINGCVLYYFNFASNWLLLFTSGTLVLLDVPIYVFLTRQFSIEERYRCMGMAHAFASMLFSSSTPVIALLWWRYFQKPVAPLGYCCLLLGMCFIAISYAKINSDKDLEHACSTPAI
jgi:MHS family proline/betaine transporter-like MFS transporter